MSEVLKHEQCPRCAEQGLDTAGDNLAVYEDGVYCFACGYTTRAVEEKFHRGDIVEIQSRKLSRDALAKFDVQIAGFTGHLGKDKYVYDETIAIFNFYEKGKAVKQKIRALSDRSKCLQIGNTKTTKLFGQHAFTPSKKIPIVVTEGEFDAVAVYQAMAYPAVSIGGAQSAVKYLSANIQWLSEWAYIVLCFDSDEAGQDAVDKAIGLFEVGKVRIAHLPLKDANDMVKAGREEELKRCIWNAEIMKPSTIVGISDIRDRILKKPVHGTPWHYEEMNKATYGLMPGTMYVVAAAEGIGKTEFVKEMIFHLLDGGTKIGLFSFEQAAESTVQRLIGSRMNKRLHLPTEEWWDANVINEEMNRLNDQIFLYDNHGALSLESILLNIRYLVRCCGVKFIVIDNLTAICANAIIDGKTVSDVAYMGHVANQLHSIVKELKVSMCIVAHLNNDTLGKNVYVSTSAKAQESYMDLSSEDMSKMIDRPGMRWENGRMPGLENIYGSGVVRKLADYIIVLARNKVSEDDEERRTTIVKFLKCRLDSAQEGKTFRLYYNYNTGRLDTDPNFINI